GAPRAAQGQAPAVAQVEVEARRAGEEGLAVFLPLHGRQVGQAVLRLYPRFQKLMRVPVSQPVDHLPRLLFPQHTTDRHDFVGADIIRPPLYGRSKVPRNSGTPRSRSTMA